MEVIQTVWRKTQDFLHTPRVLNININKFFTHSKIKTIENSNNLLNQHKNRFPQFNEKNETLA